MALFCLALCMIKSYALFAYPLYQTYQQIKNEGQNLKLWSYFWFVFAAFSLVETLSCQYIEMIPLYSWIKAVLFVYLYSQHFQGALLLGDKLKPVFQTLVEKTKPIQDKFAPFIQ